MPLACKTRDSVRTSIRLFPRDRKRFILPLPPPSALKKGNYDASFRNGGIPQTMWAFLLVLVVLSLAVFLSPELGQAARLADEDQPVTTAPSPAQTPASAGQTASQPIPAPRRAPEASQALPSGVSTGTSGSGPTQSPPGSERQVRRAAAGAPVAAAPPVPAIPPSQPSGPDLRAATTPLPSPATTEQKPSATSRTNVPQQAGRYVTIDFDNVDIQVFIKFVSELTGRNFVIDDKVKGKVTVISPKKIAIDEVYKVFESVLEIYGFVAVPAGDVVKVIPALDARGKNMETLLGTEGTAPEDKIVTQILSLQHASPEEMKKVLDPLISKNSIVLSYPPTGMLIIADVQSNIKRLQEIVTALDVDGVGEVITYIPLRYASSVDVVRSLTAMFQPQAGRGVIAPIKVVADERTNALIVLATENDTARIRELLNLMDRMAPRGAGSIRVYYLQNAKAEDLVKVLSSLPQQGRITGTTTPTTTTTTGMTTAATTAPVFSKNIQIMADKATNSLIITADPSDYLIIEDVIRQLDITRAMVYLEGLIMEVNANKSFGVGVQWSLAQDAKISQVEALGGKSVGVVGFTGNSIIPQVSSSGTTSLPSGFSVGIIGAGITVGGVTFPNIGAMFQAYQNDADVRILSTPQLLTLDNEDAEITVGSNVPYVTRQDTTLGTTTNYSNYEYKDVGVTLKVTPQINKEGFIRMKLDQSVTKILSQSSAVDASGHVVLTPTTLKRTAKTTVMVKSGETVVIGGMIQDDSEYDTAKVPILGDIPLLGWLFKTKNTTSQKTNLFIFITPRIIQKPEDASIINEEKREYIRSIQEGTVRNRPLKRTDQKESE